MGNKNISVDFDGVLNRREVEDYIASLITLGFKPHILTSREPEDYNEAQLIDNSDLHKVADRLGIPSENIFFTSYVPKHYYLAMTDMLFHLDDSQVELKEIEKLTNVKAINSNKDDFRDQCNKVLGLI